MIITEDNIKEFVFQKYKLDRDVVDRLVTDIFDLLAGLIVDFKKVKIKQLGVFTCQYKEEDIQENSLLKNPKISFRANQKIIANWVKKKRAFGQLK
jgi:nucleoid DNA-binding protein